jgi:thiol-disulfide isomerase/thioredoxin
LNTKNKLFLLLTATSLIFTACNEHNEKSKISEENKVKVEEKNSIIIEHMINNIVHDSNMTKITKKIKSTKSIKKEAITSTFTFKNFEKQTSVLSVKNDIYNFTNIEQDIVMINLSSTWCPPCRGLVPHLSSLQKKFKDNLFILTALVHDDIKESELKKLIVSEKAQFFVSINQGENEKFEKMIIKKLGITENLKLPLMVLFSNGKYFTHYEGSMPEEMIESDIKLLLEKIKERKK